MLSTSIFHSKTKNLPQECIHCSNFLRKRNFSIGFEVFEVQKIAFGVLHQMEVVRMENYSGKSFLIADGSVHEQFTRKQG